MRCSSNPITRVFFSFLFALTVPVSVAAQEAGAIVQGSEVSLEYTLTIDQDNVVDTNVGRDPLIYTQGSQEILPALESALAGMRAGEEKQIVLAPEQAYGEVNSDAFHEVPLQDIPEEARIAGELLIMEDSTGARRQIRVSEVREDTILLDLNHPLAGKTLTFDVKILEVQ